MKLLDENELHNSGKKQFDVRAHVLVRTKFETPICCNFRSNYTVENIELTFFDLKKISSRSNYKKFDDCEMKNKFDLLVEINFYQFCFCYQVGVVNRG